MPPERKGVSTWIADYPGAFTYDGYVLYCRVCEKNVSCTKKFQIDQHVKTSLHIAGWQNKGARPQLITAASSSDCTVIASNISPIVQLNIGGDVYTTTLGTLRKYQTSKLYEMFNGQPKLRTDAEGRFFIDRDGKYFKYVLEYLRNGQLPDQFVLEVYREAQFYEIEPLVKKLEESPQIFGEQVGRKQFLARVPNYHENIELMIRIARAEVVASRHSNVYVCVVRTEEEASKSQDALNSLDMDKESVVKFGPWKASPGVTDLLDCIKVDIEDQGYKVAYGAHVADKGFLFKSHDFFYKFVFTWW